MKNVLIGPSATEGRLQPELCRSLICFSNPYLMSFFAVVCR